MKLNTIHIDTHGLHKTEDKETWAVSGHSDVELQIGEIVFLVDWNDGPDAPFGCFGQVINIRPSRDGRDDWFAYLETRSEFTYFKSPRSETDITTLS